MVLPLRGNTLDHNFPNQKQESQNVTSDGACRPSLGGFSMTTTNNTTNNPNNRILRISEVLYRTGLSRSAFYLLVKNGDFDKKVPMGKRGVGWAESGVQKWIDDRIASSRA